ncbi:GntR family transcriptional regulator [Nocardiopsis changdeensis]|uniref:GntR family transcriptional regulator n=1 Tax=Nocardiopsis changdeensis TaxID=2831969 RepID=A0ABX8BPK3_9ACTN|nr:MULTISPECIES: GntR family transcriptional regulator [Nocardiopsis]QUX22678.1 GntR family transcriptional regulator [Nocardiopsis changdeensis]QYX38621.1 GntR family transcriptional regulator [Nocardiopsis sp. MT53]
MPAHGQLTPVPRRSTAELIAEQLRSAIMYGSLAPGDQLGEADLAGRLGVSRGPLREAMQRLVQEGLLRSERHRGLFVRELTPDDVRDIYVARLAVERTACELIMRGNRGEAVARLTPAVQRLAEAAATGDRRAMSDADQEFHRTLVSCSGNGRLERMAQTLLVETRMCLTVMQEVYPEPAELLEEHRRLLDAIADGAEERLLHLIETHMTDTVARINNGAPPAP